MRFKGNIAITIAILVIFLINQLFLKSTGFWFFTDYLNDLMAVPLFFSILNTVYLWESNKKIIKLSHYIAITTILTILGEFVAVFTRDGSVIDIFDICFYFIGMFLYYFIERYNINWKWIYGRNND